MHSRVGEQVLTSSCLKLIVVYIYIIYIYMIRRRIHIPRKMLKEFVDWILLWLLLCKIWGSKQNLCNHAICIS